ncbi:ABC transporter substrate-binding protein [Rathayibacter sp. SD072]|uniref:ABC transporter substrate-binding protein n=1 Tax=Rathayibacter sp. SD072 TaxID=2781731 RepID=UPI001A97C596|nr:extracellular solute-binding protein [Rathayibacter sp. SD072]MBO0985244.1 extracellular solute-binding protein [Rathayibacter sp. SD072]
MTRHSKRLLAAGVAVAASAAALTGCSAGSEAASCENTIVNDEAKVVTMWAWYPEFEGVVDLFNNSHDDVQICWSNAGAGNDEYTKLTTAVQAGSGAPDVVMLESEVVQSYIPQDALVDLTEYGAADVQQNYSEGAWADVSSGSGTYAIPVDGGPVGMLYRQDILDEYGIPVPTTWEEYAAAAQALKDAGSTTLMTDYAGNGRAYQQALFAQAGSVPYTVDGTDVTVDVDDEASAKVMNYWNDLVGKGLVGTEDSSTTDYNTHLVDGTYASVIAAAWLPGYLQGFEGADPDAVWRAAPVPQWEGEEPTQINIGGSAFAVTEQAEDKEAAALVAKEIFGTEEAWKIGIEKAALFPLWKPILESDYFANLEYDFFGGQQINKDVFLTAATEYQGFQVSPFQNFAYDKLTEAVNAVNSGESSVEDALATYQTAVSEYAAGQGYTVG